MVGSSGSLNCLASAGSAWTAAVLELEMIGGKASRMIDPICRIMIKTTMALQRL
jgi:hypothetical protein